MDCCVEHEKEQKLGRLLDEMATERTNKVITMLFFCFWCSLLAYHSMMLSQRWNCTQNTPISNTTLIISHRFWFSLKPSENVMS